LGLPGGRPAPTSVEFVTVRFVPVLPVPTALVAVLLVVAEALEVAVLVALVARPQPASASAHASAASGGRFLGNDAWRAVIRVKIVRPPPSDRSPGNLHNEMTFYI
jgi:hypothetical protein